MLLCDLFLVHYYVYLQTEISQMLMVKKKKSPEHIKESLNKYLNKTSEISYAAIYETKKGMWRKFPSAVVVCNGPRCSAEGCSREARPQKTCSRDIFGGGFPAEVMWNPRCLYYLWRSIVISVDHLSKLNYCFYHSFLKTVEVSNICGNKILSTSLKWILPDIWYD